MTPLRVLNDWLLLPQRVAVHEPTGTAVIADAHLGYRERRRAHGDAVPMADPGDELAPLWQAHALVRFQRLIVAGDLFERALLPERYAELLALLASLGVEWLGLVPGNHDRGPVRRAVLPLWPDGYALGDWIVAHGDAEPNAGRRIIGHWHPCVRVQRRKLPCFLVADDGLVLPAFSRDTAGVDVQRDRRWDRHQRIAIVRDRLVAVGA